MMKGLKINFNKTEFIPINTDHKFLHKNGRKCYL